MRIIAPVALLAIFALSSCAGLDKPYQAPKGYEPSMQQLYDGVLDLNTAINGQYFEKAKHQAWLNHDLAEHLRSLEPTRGVTSVADQEDYRNLVLDMKHTLSLIFDYVSKRQQADALERLDEFVVRFNALTSRYGPALKLPDFGANRGLDMPEKYRDVKTSPRTYY